jgi:hypothetical protein
MKAFCTCTLFLSTLLFISPAIAQETCKVLMATIADHYEGDCKKGKASGQGKAEGTDQYVGEFKDGLPHGKGTYRWKNGDFYEGNWISGRREGSGGMSYKRNGKTDSVVTGFWKKDLYAGLYEKPYIIHSRSIRIIKIDISRNVREKNNAIIVEVQNTTGGTVGINTGPQPKPELTDLTLEKGNYGLINKALSGPKSTTRQLSQVDFPFRALFKFGDQEADIEIFEPGYWKIFVNMNN